jgi:hypothetical protein
VTLVGVRTTREDGIVHDFGTASELTLGDVHAVDTRSAVWTFRLTTPGTKVFTFRSWSENGGTATTNVTVVDAKPDLQVTALGAPASAQPGESISVANTVANLGQTTAAASVLRIYLSGDSVCTTGDTYLPPERTVPGLAVGGTSTANSTVTIPAGTALGDRYVCAITDYDDAIAETDETNNTRSTPISIVRPDLQVTDLTGPASAGAGTAITVNDTVRNLGTATSPASVLRLYLSTDSVCATSDAYLPPERAVPSLAVNGTSAGSTSVTIPLATAPGVRYVCAIADHNNAVAESNEGNNTRSYAIAVTAPPPPTVDLEINGQDAAYPMFVTTPGPIRLTIDMTAGTAPVDHYFAIIFGTAVYWLDPTGRLVTTPTPLARFTPANLNDLVLLNVDFGASPGFWGFAWIMIDGATVVSSDVILANVTGVP